MDLDKAKAWARVLSTPQKSKKKRPNWLKRKPKVKTVQPDINTVNFTAEQERQILWNALYYPEKDGKQKLLESRHDWWLLLLMHNHHDLNELAEKTERPKAKLLALYKHYIEGYS